MTVREYLQRPDHLRFVVAAPALAEGMPAEAERILAAVVTSAHQTEETAKEAVRWAREQVRREIHDRHAFVDRIVIDLDAIIAADPLR